jgi:signal transduction histidine kinase
LYVRDNGIGIPEKHDDAILRSFKRLHARDTYGGGTGAGLTIVKKIA